jgi:hypothetical protein
VCEVKKRYQSREKDKIIKILEDPCESYFTQLPSGQAGRQMYCLQNWSHPKGNLLLIEVQAFSRPITYKLGLCV